MSPGNAMNEANKRKGIVIPEIRPRGAGYFNPIGGPIRGLKLTDQKIRDNDETV